MGLSTAWANLVVMGVTGTPGTGTITLGSAVAPFFGTSELTSGATYAYQITDGSNVCTGHGVATNTAGTWTLTRDAAERCNVAGTPQSTPMSLTTAAQVSFVGALAADVSAAPKAAGQVTLAGGGKYSVESSFSDPNVTTNSIIVCNVSGAVPGGYADELELEPLEAYGRCTVNGTILIRISARGRIYGNRAVNYILI